MNANEVATWASLALSAVSLPVTIGGFWFAIVQLRKTQSSVEAVSVAIAQERVRTRNARLRDLAGELRRLADDVHEASAASDWPMWRRSLRRWLWLAAEADDVLPQTIDGDTVREVFRTASSAAAEAMELPGRRQQAAAAQAASAVTSATVALVRELSRLTSD